MIRHPGARTRALYKWEEVLLYKRATGGNRKVRSQKEGEFIIARFWAMEKRARPRPKLIIKKRLKGYPSYDPNTHTITLGGTDMYVITLLHEIVHALGLGPEGNHHSPAFVRKFIKYMSFQFGWSMYDLTCDAMEAKLL